MPSQRVDPPLGPLSKPAKPFYLLKYGVHKRHLTWISFVCDAHATARMGPGC